MARGQQKLQSQAKAQEKAAKAKKQAGHSANDQKKAAQKALVFVCSVCKVRICLIFVINFSLSTSDKYGMFSNSSKAIVIVLVCIGVGLTSTKDT